MRSERKIVVLSIVMSVSFGPLGLLVGRAVGGATESPGRWLEFIAWFLAYGVVMGLILAYAWRAERPSSRPAGRVQRRVREPRDYWIGDWSSALEELRPTTEPLQPSTGDRSGNEAP